MQIPFDDYSGINRKLKSELLREINTVLNLKNNHSHESYIKKFEEMFADYHDTKFAIGVDSGTSALQLALVASGIKEDDEVILPSYTYAATGLAVSNMGAKPVFVDIKEEDLTINPSLIETKITEKTKAIIPVHIHGNPCEMGHIIEICQRHDLKLIEDASQAHGAEYNGRKIGSFGIGCFSLHSSKTLGGIGCAGTIILDDEEIYDKIRKLMVPDNNTKEILSSKRTPCYIDAIQAAVIKVKLAYLDGFNERKQDIAASYNKLLVNANIKKIIPIKDSHPVYRDYCIMIKERDELQKFLRENGIETKARYKLPLHLTNTFSYLGYEKGDFPVSEKMSNEILCLPSFIGIKDREIKHISDEINDFCQV